MESTLSPLRTVRPTGRGPSRQSVADQHGCGDGARDHQQTGPGLAPPADEGGQPEDGDTPGHYYGHPLVEPADVRLGPLGKWAVDVPPLVVRGATRLPRAPGAGGRRGPVH